MTDPITTRSTSSTTAQAGDIVLRHGPVTRLVFRPLLITNPHDPAASVKGAFIFQKKSRVGAWEDHRELDLSKLRATEWVKVELHSGELLQLIEGVLPLYALVRARGIEAGRHSYVEAPEGGRLLRALTDWLARQDVAGVAGALTQLTAEELESFQALVGVARIKSFLTSYAANKKNASEEFWQQGLAKHSWVLSQVFASPFVIVGAKVFVGGTQLDNRGGNLADFLYRTQLTGNPALIEIKTPVTNLVGAKYRNNAYSMGPELSGGVVQAIQNRDALAENFLWLTRDTPDVQLLRPRALLIIGSFENEALQRYQLRSFEQFRHSHRDVDVVTFDELAAKAQGLLDLLLLPKG
jgi:hypothetical protein